MSGNVLVVDDDFATREVLKELLTANGFGVFTAKDGKAALDLFRLLHPDLVLSDVRMPRVDGFEVCRQLKSSPDSRLTPVVLITSLSETEDRIRGLEAGADDFLSKPVDSSELLARVRSLLSLKGYTDELERAETVLFALARSIEARDPYTEGHCERLSEYSVQLGQALSLQHEDLTALRRAGSVHDIGKISIPDSILLKPGPLNDYEWQVMRGHTVIGEHICSPLKSFTLVLPIIRSHHEKLDGSGYPDGLHGAQIPLTARILQIVDVYDALITKRPYKPPLASEKALEILRDEVKRGWWDSDIFAEFEALIRRNPQTSRLAGSVMGAA